MARNDPRGSRGRLIGSIAFWVIFFIAFGPSIVGLVRAATTCQIWKTSYTAESTVPDESIREATKDIPDYARPESSTYLTLPEWYIVYSTDEYASFIANNPPSQFPHFKAVGQYWDSYADVCGVIRSRFPPNGGQQFALGFIGISFTAENMLKGAYEMTIGHLAELTSNGAPTEEEIYAAQVAKEYGEFLHMTPWYFFPFKEKLQGLWSISMSGPNPIRKLERKFELTLEYGGKLLYSSFTNLGAKATYGGADVEKIYAVTSGLTDDMLNDNLQLIKPVDEQRQLIHITRFEYFSNTVPGLTERGLQFVEIAGNHQMLITLLGPQDADYKFQNGEFLFDLPILTQPGLTRAAIKVRVSDLGLFLQELKGRTDIKFEHMYDY